MQDLTIISDLEHGYSLQLPKVTPAGQNVEVDQSEHNDIHRVHAHSPDLWELYFEIVSFSGLIDHDQAIAEQQASLSERAADASISTTEHSSIRGLTAKAFQFEGTLDGRWKIRRFLFADSPTRTYRIIYDPTSSLNECVLNSLALGIKHSP